MKQEEQNYFLAKRRRCEITQNINKNGKKKKKKKLINTRYEKYNVRVLNNKEINFFTSQIDYYEQANYQ